MIIKCTCSDLVNNGDHYCPLHGTFAAPTPPEGEAVTEQSKCEDACDAKNGIHTAMCHLRRNPAAPVVSTAAPEPECPICGKAECMTGLPDTTPAPERNGKELIAKYGTPRKHMEYYLGNSVCTPEEYEAAVLAVAPESYKPAEGASVGQFWTEWAKRQGLSPEESWLVSRNHARQFAEAYAAHVAPAATPVTVEAPTSDIARQIAICEENGTKWAHFKVAEIKQLLATPKPIGDVEAVARKVYEAIDEESAKLAMAQPFSTYIPPSKEVSDVMLAAIKTSLSPFFAAAGPAGLCPKCKSDTFYIECNRCDYDFMGNVFDVFKSFEAQPPCSECATLRKENSGKHCKSTTWPRWLPLQR